MPCGQHPGTGPVTGPDGNEPGPIPALAGTAGLTRDQIGRLADLIAEGRGDLPADLSPPEQDRLLDEVRRRLRDRLVHFLARAIAAQLNRDAGPRSETDHHA
jgi:hypothetical protein